jgi:EAL domain-containing protein (putative c-di-GMP-specific phosphodiesterase class I)
VRFLRKYKCDEVQGFFYGEPVEPAAHAALLARTATRKRA